jgi:membrane-associated protease RseP (regulator of RpoE activity)
MSWWMGVVIFIGALLIMTFVHESGHFITARRFGMKVEEFFIGIGPRLFSWQRGETTFGLKPILIAAYVKIAGMNPWEKIPEEELPRTYGAKPAWQRAIVVGAGSATHPVVALVLLWATLTFVGVTTEIPVISSVRARVEISETSSVTSPAAEAGLRGGDRVLEAGGKKIEEWSEFQRVIRSNAGKPVEIKVRRGSEVLTLTVTPAEVPFQFGPNDIRQVGLIGVDPQSVNRRENPIAALGHSASQTGRLIVWSAESIPLLFSSRGIGAVFRSLGGEDVKARPIGPVGIGRAAGQTAAGLGPWEAIRLISFLIVFIGLINLLPLPPLDGGHLIILLIEKIRGRKIDMRKVMPVGVAVFVFFIVLSVAVLYLDIFRPIDPFQ